MFSPPIAKQKTKSTELQRVPVVSQRHGQPALSPVQLLQRRIGNQALMRLLAQRQNEPGAPSNAAALLGVLQPKLRIGAVNVPLEHEADRVADHVMRMPAPEGTLSSAPEQVSRKCAECEEEEKHLQKKEAGAAEADAGYAPTSVHEVLRSPGQPLDATTRGFMEPRFGQDFSGVRVHTDATAAQSARDVSAHAYTVGHNVVFGAGQYQPATSAGRELLAHELSHTIQQGAALRQADQPQPGRANLIMSRPTEPLSLAKKDAPQTGPSHKANDPYQLKSELHPTGKARLFADQVASLYFGTKSYVPDPDDYRVLKALAAEYQYTAQRKGGLKGKVIGHADVELSSDPDNQELSFQRARWTALVFQSNILDAVNVAPFDFQFEIEGMGTRFCMGDPDCRGKVRPEALAQYRRADVLVFTEKMLSPQIVTCPPVSGAGVKTLGEYIELVRCAEVAAELKAGYSPREMLALLRQMYYGKPWSATAQDPFWDFVIPCSPDLGHPKDKLGERLFEALHNTVTIEGTDLGHVFTGLEAMTCPASTVTIEKSKFGVGIQVTVDLSNESFATWGGDVGSVAGAMVACWMMTDNERATKGKDDCHQGKTPESLEQYFVKRQAPPEDLEGDIAPFVIRAAQATACSGTLEKKFTPQAPISSIFTDFFYNRGPTGKTSKNRYRCFAEAIGATVVDGKITNRAALHRQYDRGVLSFAWAYYVNLKKELPRSDPVVQLLDRNSRAALGLFFDWLQARMQD
jgi:outer membrane protein OmpA-like peptidoglycan-associated protein